MNFHSYQNIVSQSPGNGGSADDVVALAVDLPGKIRVLEAQMAKMRMLLIEDPDNWLHVDKLVKSLRRGFRNKRRIRELVELGLIHPTWDPHNNRRLYSLIEVKEVVDRILTNRVQFLAQKKKARFPVGKKFCGTMVKPAA